MPDFAVLECRHSACALRFPLAAHERAPACCPLCGGALAVVARGATAGDALVQESPGDSPPPGPPLDLLIDNVRSAFNVGSILRSAEAAGVHHVWLGGITPTPDHPRVARAALGAEAVVAWSSRRNTLHVARERLESGALLWALESEADALPLSTVRLPDPVAAPGGLLLVAGSEIAGIDPDVRSLCAQAVCLPMRGRKRSLNVAVAVGAALQWLAFLRETPSSDPHSSRGGTP